MLQIARLDCCHIGCKYVVQENTQTRPDLLPHSCERGRSSSKTGNKKLLLTVATCANNIPALRISN